VHEIKHDGFRFICRREGDRVRVFSRRGHDWTDRVPRIAEAIAKLRVKSVTLDGEGVVCRDDGVSDFNRMRAAVGRLGSRNAFLYAFDLLEFNDEDLRLYEWEVRRATLASLLRRASEGIRLSEHLVISALRPRHPRPRQRAAQPRDELAPPHSMTMSARTRTLSGIVRPSALAVLRFTSSCSRVGCSTGKCAGRAPLSILST